MTNTSVRPWSLWIPILAPVLAYVFGAAAQQAFAANDMSQCRAIEDTTAKLQCYESLAPPDLVTPPSSGLLTSPVTPQTIGRWRLVRTPNPRGGKEAISLMRTGELSGSDPDFVGLMIRCAERDIEVLLVLLRSLPFRAHPRVAINGAKFEGSIAPPGSAVLLPEDVAVLARQLWPSFPSLSVEVEEAEIVTKGRISLEDFGTALKALTATCPLRQ